MPLYQFFSVTSPKEAVSPQTFKFKHYAILLEHFKATLKLLNPLLLNLNQD